jgi:4-alpha-glucanotransferase
MRFPSLDRYFTGISVPVAALRTGSSCGVGEFADLPYLAEWCRGVGFDLIQVLPVNDTGTDSSPYSALSAFALHPLYLRLQAVPEAAAHARAIDEFIADTPRRETGSKGRFDYRTVREFKLSIVDRMFADNASAIGSDPVFARWRAENPWVIPYAVFTALRKQNNAAAWSAWPSMVNPGGDEIQDWWDAHPAECMPAAWVQFLLEAQLREASRSMQSRGVFLKGDIPILMSPESADVWAHRPYFDLGARAGAPPDMFSPEGQNWSFPVYDWNALEKDGYSWWKGRLRQAGKFFHAFRIDHVLGFFRIWRIPRGELSGLLGRFSPSAGMTGADLAELGFDEGRIRWLSFPHVSARELSAALGAEAARVAGIHLNRVGTEELYTIRAEIDGERAIASLPEPPEVKGFLRSCHANRTLLEDSGSFFPAWYMEQKKGFQSLTETEQEALRRLVGRRRQESEEGWERRGRELLRMLQSATDMLVCAEDLGHVPRCVPRVLDHLGILGLRILRWSREYDSAPPGSPAPFIPPSRLPRLSVCTPSVHDTSTLRGWWEEDRAERALFHQSLGTGDACPEHMTRELLQAIIAHCCDAASVLAIFQIQDVLDLDESLWAADPRIDRINVPGTLNDTNWTWRMPVSIESLGSREQLCRTIRALTEKRRNRAAEGEVR